LIRLENKGNSVSGLIKDDGKGFNVKAVLSSNAPEKRIGLIGMRERITGLGGEFGIQSSLKKGTQITFNIPLINSK
jgi:signal transduction histidine kinase